MHNDTITRTYDQAQSYGVVQSAPEPPKMNENDHPRPSGVQALSWSLYM